MSLIDKHLGLAIIEITQPSIMLLTRLSKVNVNLSDDRVLACCLLPQTQCSAQAGFLAVLAEEVGRRVKKWWIEESIALL